MGCFAEKWLRATNSEGEPTGAIAALMSTINQSWNPPMLGQDEMNVIDQVRDKARAEHGDPKVDGSVFLEEQSHHLRSMRSTTSGRKTRRIYRRVISLLLSRVHTLFSFSRHVASSL